MADQQPLAAPAPAESAAPEPVGPQTFEEIADAAQQSLESAAEGTEVKAPAPVPGQAEQIPEHLGWARSVSGLADPTTGEISVDRLAKQAFEVNKAFQAQARTLAQFEGLLKIPKIAAAFRELAGDPGPAPPAVAKATDGEAPQTEEQILADFVRGELKKFIEPTLAPLQQQIQTVYKQYEDSQMELAYRNLQEEFGKTEDGQHYVYDTVRDQVASMIVETARQANVQVGTLLSHLIRNNQLAQTFSSAARNILFPAVRQQVETVRKAADIKKMADQKRTRLTSPGSPARDVGTVRKQAPTFEEAAEQAEQELSA